MSFTLGILTKHQCENIVPPPDTRCSDPEFALLNPTICPAQPKLVIKPSVALSCQLGSVQFRAFKTVSGQETDVTASALFVSSDPLTAVVGASTGNATGLAAGLVTISATYQGMSAQASLDVLAGTDCCQQEHVALLVAVDNSRSMSLGFDATYATRLDFARAAATRFITEINGSKDEIGLLSFTASQHNLMADPTGDTAAVAALVPQIAPTADKTSFYDAIQAGVAALNATASDRKILVLISDGEDTAGTDVPGNSPLDLLNDFRSQGGIVMVLGVRASAVNNGFYLLSLMASGGFFVNAYHDTAQAALDYLSGLKGYVCAGNCTPAGDKVVNQGQLNYTGFARWTVSEGNVDLLGNGFLDLLPGNGLYVDLGGSQSPFNGKLSLTTPVNLIGGHTYRLTIRLAGNQQADANDLIAKVLVLDAGGNPILSQSVSITSQAQGFQTYAFSFSPASDSAVTVTIQQALAPGYASVADPRWGLLLDGVSLYDATDLHSVLDDNFDAENPVYVPPGCGTGTTWVWLAGLGRYGYATGGTCHGGYGCLSGPPGDQLPDPNPLSDVESGGPPPPQTFTSTKQACATCPAGTAAVSDLDLIPLMTGNTTPSGTASASTEFPGGALVPGKAWEAFNEKLSGNYTAGQPIGWTATAMPAWLRYDFPTAQVVTGYSVFCGSAQGQPKSWTFEGSNDGSTWTVLDTQIGIGGWLTVEQVTSRRRFSVNNAAAYLSYRINVSATVDGNPASIYEFRMMGAAVTSVCRTATYVSQISQADADSRAYAAALAQAQNALACQAVYTSTQPYTATCTGGCGVPVTRSATAVSFSSQLDADNAATAAAKVAAEAALDCSQSNNGQAITLPAVAWNQSYMGPAVPMPTGKYVSAAGNVAKVTAVVTGLGPCVNGDSFILLLRGPDGTCVLLYYNNDQFAEKPVPAAVNLTFDDAGSVLPANNTALASGTYRPYNGAIQPGLTLQPSAPQKPYALTLAAFIGKPKAGCWTLWVGVRSSAPSQISGGWDLTIT